MKSFRPKKSRPKIASARREAQPIDAARLDGLALAYVARFATSGARLEAYLLRKAMASPGGGRQLSDDGDDTGPGIDRAALREAITALVARLVAAGYIDDQAFASARSGGLQRRGYGGRHIAQTLGQAGVAKDITANALPGERAGRQAALVLARKRRLGPFGAAPVDRAAREKQLAVLLRAGHRLDSARELVNAPSVAAAEAWARFDDDGDDEEAE